VKNLSSTPNSLGINKLHGPHFVLVKMLVFACNLLLGLLPERSVVFPLA